MEGRWTFASEGWDGISAEAKDLVRGLMTRDPAQRLTAQQALQVCGECNDYCVMECVSVCVQCVCVFVRACVRVHTPKAVNVISSVRV